jgi:TolB-like protein
MTPTTLSPRTRLAHYDIVSRLGAGGMGEVYRAYDSTLARDVAIKVLPPHLSDDPEMRERFEREAQALASLSHPNILAIHELGCVEGVSFVVTELLEGESLRQRLANGPLPWRSVVEVSAQAADALAVAHAKGVVHRDVKPENLFLLKSGWLKMLDFGLARLTTVGEGADQPTMAVLTEARRILGTLGYMAPEQAVGEPAGPRADIFALGCVMYEMVTGKRPFQGTTPAETIAATLRSVPPPLDEAAPGTPMTLQRIIEHCLVKDASARFSSAADVAAALRAVVVDAAFSPGPVRARKLRPGERSVAVLPFAHDGDAEADYVADGVTEAVINRLSQVPGFRVVPRGTSFQFKGRDIDLTSAALALNAQALVTGRVVTREQIVSIQVELIDAATQDQVWGHRYRKDVSGILACEEEVAEHVAQALNICLVQEHKRRARRHGPVDVALPPAGPVRSGVAVA